MYLFAALSSWEAFSEALLNAIREQGLATAEVLVVLWLIIVALRNTRDAIQAVWSYLKPLGEEVAESASQWFRAMTEEQLAHTRALAELANTIQRMDKGRLIEEIHAITSRNHEKLSELAGQGLACKASSTESPPKP